MKPETPQQARLPRATAAAPALARVTLAAVLIAATLLAPGGPAARPGRRPRARLALADDTSLGRFGETVRPIRNGQVEMVEEEVVVRVGPRYSLVTCRFVFHNTGAATELLMGFPEEATDPDREMGDDVGIHDFRTWVDGREVPPRRESGGPGLSPPEGGEQQYPLEIPPRRPTQYPFWWTWPVSLDAGETIEVRNSYRVRNTFISNGEVRAGYVLTTGGAWKGPIGRAKVTFEFDGPRPFHLTRVYPGTYRFAGDSIVWEWTDFEPAADIEVVFSVTQDLMSYSTSMTVASHTDAAPPAAETSPQGERTTDLFWKIFNAASQWRNAEALQHVRDYAALPGLPPEAAEAAALLEARFRFMEGDREYGGPLWEKRVETGAAGADDYYFLGSLYEERRDRAGLASLYRRLAAAAPPGSEPPYGDTRWPLWVVRRWLASRVEHPAPGEFTSGDNAPVVEKVAVEWQNPAAPVALVLRPTVKDPDGDLAAVRLRIWTREDGQETILLDTLESVHGGGYHPSPGVTFSLPWPLATVRYRLVAVDATGRTADTGEVEWSVDGVAGWQHAKPAPGGGLIRLRYHGEAGRSLAAEVNSRLGLILDNLESRLGIRPCNRVIVSFYEHEADEPAAAIAASFPDYPWYVLEEGRAPTAERVAADVLSRVLAHNAGPAWYTRPGAEPGWLLEGLAEVLAGTQDPARGPATREAWMVESLLARGEDKFAELIRKAGNTSNAGDNAGDSPVNSPDGVEQALREVYGVAEEELDRDWLEELARRQTATILRVASRAAMAALAGVLAWGAAAALRRRLARCPGSPLRRGGLSPGAARPPRPSRSLPSR